MDYSSFYYFDVDHVIYFGKRVLFPDMNNETHDLEFEKRLEAFKNDDVHKGLGYCPCWSRNRVQQPNVFVHLFKDCASVIYGLSCFPGNNDSKQKLILAHDQDPRSRGLYNTHYRLARWNMEPKGKPGTLVFRIDFVHIKPDMVKHEHADHGRDRIPDIKRDWHKNVYGLVGARRPPDEEEELEVEEEEEDYPPAGLVFIRYCYNDIPDDQRKLSVSADGHLLLNGPFLPLVIRPKKTILLDIDLSCFVMLDVLSYSNNIPGFYKCIEFDKPKTCCLDGLNGAVTVGYSIITMAVYVRFVASIVIPSSTLPLYIYGHITVDEHLHVDHRSFLFYAERDRCQQLKHGDYLTFTRDSMALQKGKDLTISVSLYQCSPSSTSRSDDIVFVDRHISFSPSVSNHENESQQEKKILSDDDDQEGNGINFMIWALAVGRKTEKLATGGNDSLVNIWHDCTIDDEEELLTKKEELAQKDQELSNVLLKTNYEKAIQLAI